MSTENGIKVLGRMAVTEHTSLTVRAKKAEKSALHQTFGILRKVILKGEVLEVRNVDGGFYVARMPRFHNDWDPPIEPYDPYGPATRGDDDIND